jgi:hypothetical protein
MALANALIPNSYNVYFNSLTTNLLNVKIIDASEITVNELNAVSIMADDVNTNTLEATTATINSATITTLDSTSISSLNINTTTITAETGLFTEVSSTTLVAECASNYASTDQVLTNLSIPNQINFQGTLLSDPNYDPVTSTYTCPNTGIFTIDIVAGVELTGLTVGVNTYVGLTLNLLNITTPQTLRQSLVASTYLVPIGFGGFIQEELRLQWVGYLASGTRIIAQLGVPNVNPSGNLSQVTILHNNSYLIIRNGT